MNPTSRIYWQAIFYREAFQKSLGLSAWGEANSPRWKKWRQQPDPHALKGCRSFPSCLRQRVCAQKTTISQAFHFGPSGKKSLKHTHTHTHTSRSRTRRARRKRERKAVSILGEPQRGYSAYTDGIRPKSQMEESEMHPSQHFFLFKMLSP